MGKFEEVVYSTKQNNAIKTCNTIYPIHKIVGIYYAYNKYNNYKDWYESVVPSDDYWN